MGDGGVGWDLAPVRGSVVTRDLVLLWYLLLCFVMLSLRVSVAASLNIEAYYTGLLVCYCNQFLVSCALVMLCLSVVCMAVFSRRTLEYGGSEQMALSRGEL